MSPSERWNNGLDGSANVQGTDLDLYDLWRLFRQRWKVLLLAAALPAIVLFLISSFVLRHTWAAVATLRPINQQSQLAQMMGVMGGGLLGSTVSGLGSALGLSPQNDEAEEYITILESYDFTMNLVTRHRLENYLSKPGWLSRWGLWSHTSPPSNWTFYKTMTERFHSEFDLDSGNLELRFVDQDKAMAARILSWYVDGLRDMLRAENIRNSQNALTALQQQARATEDVFLQSQLYQLAAVQLQNVKIAEAQSDFAFKEIQSPVVSDRPYSPHPMRNAAIGGLAGMLSAIMWILIGFSNGRPETGRVLLQGDSVVEYPENSTQYGWRPGNRPAIEEGLAANGETVASAADAPASSKSKRTA
jgi:subunit length determinant Wzz-like protein